MVVLCGFRNLRSNLLSDAAPRSVSDPILNSKPPGGSPTSARPPIAATAPAHRMEMARAPPRTSSIDSAISSLSNGNHSHKSSQDMQSRSSASPDIANLIQAAGSSEAVIQYLLKEKQSSAAQNAQLWRLVDKQRAMILGLNKDLERALKDKEKYRKKLKESLAQIPGPNTDGNRTPGSAGDHEPSAQNAKTSPSLGHVEALVSAGLRESEGAHDELPQSPIDVALAPYPITPPANQSEHVPPSARPLSNMVPAEEKMPSPSAHAFENFNADAPAPGFEAGQQMRKMNEIEAGLPYNASVPPSRSLPADPPKTPTPPVQSPPTSPGDQAQKAFSTPRKAPPAPLNLAQPNMTTSVHLHQTDTIDHSDSDYDDMLEADQIPVMTERGRRKTREEDERQRELAAMQDAEIRSLSKKSSKGGSKATTPKSIASPTLPADMPISPRTVQILPPGADDRSPAGADSNAESLAEMLSATRSEFNRNVVAPPPMSPGLPSSPRPVDRGVASPMARSAMDRSSHQSSMASPPLSPRGLAAYLGGLPLSPRAPRQPIPLPPNTPMSIASPGLPAGEPLLLVSPRPLQINKKTSVSAGENERQDSPVTRPTLVTVGGVYRGLMTEEYPEFLLPPNALPLINIKVASSRLKPSRASLISPNKLDEDPVFTLAIFSRSEGRELWRVEKDSMSLQALDQQLKRSSYFLAKTPERNLFSGHAPAKVDARRIALDSYFGDILNNQMDIEMALEICKYLSSNTMEPNADEMAPASDSSNGSPTKTGPGGRPFRNGYLTKRGKNFGGWKARFFVLDGPILKYYESPGGPHLGVIKLQKAQIGKQQQNQENQSPSRNDVDDAENQYRHAFLILEPKRKDSSSLVRHVLCAENDEERDQWVDALLQWVSYKEPGEEEPARPRQSRKDSNSSASGQSGQLKKKQPGSTKLNPPASEESLRAIGYETTVAGDAPKGGRSRSRTTGSASPPTTGKERDAAPANQSQQARNISAPKNVHVIQDAGQWGNKPANLSSAADDKIKQKKRSFFGFGSRPRASSESHEAINDSMLSFSQMAYEQHGPIRPVFGAPLSEAVRFCHPVNVQIDLPAVVYRCMEYLDSKGATDEEGIFRLSGSNVVIKQLRERFNVEGDVNLIDDEQYYDIHAVASLLKLYLRELPSTILTRELHLEFLAVTELKELDEKISALNGLVHRLPRVNATLLRYLAGFLIGIVNNCDTNKMTVRNVGIVFSPTLNIPAPVFALFLQQYDGIFSAPQPQAVEVTVTAPPLSPEDIRSPRRQKFQDLPTPSYDQQSFPRQEVDQRPPGFPQPKHYQRLAPAVQDTGFAPMQQYDATMAGPEYGARGSTLAGPAYEQYGGSRKKRNSAMLGGGASRVERKGSRGRGEFP
jgi:RalA-binding protein 1